MTLRSSDPSHQAQRAAVANRDLVRHVIAHLLATAADWAMFVGVLVYAFERGGPTATGSASIALLVSYLAASLVAGGIRDRFPPARTRAGGFAVQAIAFGIASAAAFADAPIWMVVAPGMIGAGALTTLKPSGATLLPAIVHSTRELGVGNLWTGYAESVGSLAGPLVAAGLLALGGPAEVMIGCALLAAAALVVTVVPRLVDPPGNDNGDHVRHNVRRLVGNVSDLRSRPGVLGVLTVAGAQFVVIGALDIIVVVVAQDQLGLGPSGPGLLLTALGLGSITGGVVTAALIGRERLAPIVVGAMLIVATLLVMLGINLTAIAAFVLLPLIGVSRGLIDVLTDVLLHRSAAPEVLTSVYAVIEISTGLGLLLGAIGTQALIATSGVEAALIGAGGFYVLLVICTAATLRDADASADVPVVSMSLIRSLPVFGNLPRAELETLCRSASETVTEPGQVILTQGDVGDRYYAVMSGEFDIDVDGVKVHRARRGDGFGEIALLASVPRTATVTSATSGRLLAIERAPFLIAVTGHDGSRQATWGVAGRDGEPPEPGIEARGA